MAVDFTTLQTNLTAWVELLSSLEVEWGRQPQKIHAGPFILAYAGEITSLGHDERIYTFDSQTDQQVETMIGVRRFPLRLSFRSPSDQRLGGSSRQYAEEFRLMSQSTNSIEFLQTNDIGLVDIGPLIDTDYTWSGRRVSQVDVTVNLALRLNSANTIYSGDYINTVNITPQRVIITNDNDFVVDQNGDYVVSNGDAFTVTTV